MFSRLVELDRLRAKTRKSEETDLSGQGLKDPDRCAVFSLSLSLSCQTQKIFSGASR